MRGFCRTISVACALLLACAVGLGQEKAGPQRVPAVRLKPAQKVAAAKEIELRYELNPDVAPVFAQILKVSGEGGVEIAPPLGLKELPAAQRTALIEGYYLGVVQESADSPLEGARLMRVQVLEVRDEGRATLQIARESAKRLKADEFMMLFRPIGATTAQMKSLPEVAQIEEGSDEPGQGETGAFEKTCLNLKQIGLALHNYHDTHGHFPPAVINGPDGKPWHSWRVLLLPFLDQAQLYNTYHFDEPWDGPRNKLLLEKMPAVYSDPVHGMNQKHVTHYVAVTGDGMGFESEGVEFDGDEVPLGGGLGLWDFTDGTSNTILIGPATPEQEIPWMQPTDLILEVDEGELPNLAEEGSFPTPHRAAGKRVAPFLRCDGSVVALQEGLSGRLLRQACTRNGGEPFTWESYPAVYPNSIPRQMPVITIESSKQGPVARVRMEPIPTEQSPLPPPAVEVPRPPGGF